MVADNPDQKIDLKTFHAQIINDHQALKAEQDAYNPIPVIIKLDSFMVQRNYMEIRQDVQHIAESEMERIARAISSINCLFTSLKFDESIVDTIPIFSISRRTLNFT